MKKLLERMNVELISENFELSAPYVILSIIIFVLAVGGFAWL